ncbi:MAG: hypothetical protein AAB491_00955 [Patescibacteria group bacterium]
MNTNDLDFLKEILKDSDSVEVLKILDSLGNTKDLILREISDKKIGNCWINGSRCQYSNPEGKIIYAPIELCARCQIFLYFKETESFRLLLKGMINDEIEERIDDLKIQYGKKSKDTNEFLENLIDRSEKDEKIKLILRDFLKVLNNCLDLEKIDILAMEDIEE